MSNPRETIKKSIDNAAEQQAKAKTPQEASEWQGIINQNLQAIKDLNEEEKEDYSEEAVNLNDKK